MKRHRWLVGWLIVACVLAGCGRVEHIGGAPVPTEPEEQALPTLPSALPASNVILMDGELVAAYPSIELAFPGGVSGQVLGLEVEVGQRVGRGDLIATLDDRELRRAVDDARLALGRAREDLARARADAEEEYQDGLEEARDKFERETVDAEDAYERELDEAQDALEDALSGLQQARMEPPTTAVKEARVELDRALGAEAEAADNYKQALDRPWEPQRSREALYREWQRAIVDRDLAQLRLQDAEISLKVYAMDLETREQDVERAKDKLDRVERDEVEVDEVERETDFASYERAVADAEAELADVVEDLENASLYAPWDGLVLSIDTSVGAMISSGTPVVTLLNLEGLYCRTENLSERHVAQLREGQGARITLRTYPDDTVTGQVRAVVPQTERQGDSEARFAAYIRLDESELDLLPGMTGRVEIVTGGE